MSKANFFFLRKESSAVGIRKPSYAYLGYYMQESGYDKHYPVILTFGKNHLDFLFQAPDGKTYKTFSLYIADGDLNQEILTRKIEDYWKMPIWPLNKNFDLAVDKSLLSISYFSRLNEFTVMDDKFVKYSLFKNARIPVEIEDDKIKFPYDNGYWQFDKLDICAFRIDFRKILLDFLYELEYANTFEDEDYFSLQPALQNNKLLNALSRKCRYLDELCRFGQASKGYLPKQLRDAEREWLQVCFSEDYASVFSARRVFSPAEDEVEAVLFQARLGASGRKREYYYSSKRDDEYKEYSSNVRNQSATFFLRHYNLLSAFRVLLKPWQIATILVALPVIPIGDWLIDRLGKGVGFPVCSLAIPLIGVFLIGYYYVRNRINLFKLLLPRLSLGVLMGWSFFWSSGDLWKSLLLMSWPKVISLSLTLLFILFLYVFTDMRNKLAVEDNRAVIGRASILIGVALFISLINGFYVIQFYAEPMYESDYQYLQRSNANLFKRHHLAILADNDSKAVAALISEELCRNPNVFNDQCQRLKGQKINDCDKPAFKQIVQDSTKVEECKFDLNEEFVMDVLNRKQLYEELKAQGGHFSRFIMVESNIGNLRDRNLQEFNRNVIDEYLAEKLGEKVAGYEPHYSGSFRMLSSPWLKDEHRDLFVTEVPMFGGLSLLYIWKVLFAQFVASIIVGIVLQLLWEDRPITEPL